MINEKNVKSVANAESLKRENRDSLNQCIVHRRKKGVENAKNHKIMKNEQYK